MCMFRTVISNGQHGVVKVLYSSDNEGNVISAAETILKELPLGWYIFIFTCDNENEPSKTIVKELHTIEGGLNVKA